MSPMPSLALTSAPASISAPREHRRWLRHAWRSAAACAASRRHALRAIAPPQTSERTAATIAASPASQRLQNPSAMRSSPATPPRRQPAELGSRWLQAPLTIQDDADACVISSVRDMTKRGREGPFLALATPASIRPLRPRRRLPRPRRGRGRRALGGGVAVDELDHRHRARCRRGGSRPSGRAV